MNVIRYNMRLARTLMDHSIITRFHQQQRSFPRHLSILMILRRNLTNIKIRRLPMRRSLRLLIQTIFKISLRMILHHLNCPLIRIPRRHIRILGNATSVNKIRTRNLLRLARRASRISSRASTLLSTLNVSMKPISPNSNLRRSIITRQLIRMRHMRRQNIMTHGRLINSSRGPKLLNELLR